MVQAQFCEILEADALGLGISSNNVDNVTMKEYCDNLPVDCSLILHHTQEYLSAFLIRITL